MDTVYIRENNKVVYGKVKGSHAEMENGEIKKIEEVELCEEFSLVKVFKKLLESEFNSTSVITPLGEIRASVYYSQLVGERLGVNLCERLDVNLGVIVKGHWTDTCHLEIKTNLLTLETTVEVNISGSGDKWYIDRVLEIGKGLQSFYQLDYTSWLKSFEEKAKSLVKKREEEREEVNKKSLLRYEEKMKKVEGTREEWLEDFIAEVKRNGKAIREVRTWVYDSCGERVETFYGSLTSNNRVVFKKNQRVVKKADVGTRYTESYIPR